MSKCICGKCMGSGEIYASKQGNPDDDRSGGGVTRCKRCNGTGYIEGIETDEFEIL